MGYDQVQWGASIADVRRIYSIGEDIVLNSKSAFYSQSTDPNVATLVQTNVSDSILERVFYFNKWQANDYRLYRVWVTYRDTSDSTAQNLQSVLVSRFGNRTDYDIQTGTTYLMFQQLSYTKEIYTFGRYSPELVVELIHTVIYAGYEKDTNNLLGQNALQVCYTWKKFRDEYQASRLGL
jgi:hypothetical protein